ncbi:MAG: bifunctional glutamate N-acetyltransferase/amino-acid acetyltransferase ArgJ [Rhodospirillaceae bacterium]|nr:bifunctional glutamate N-acetyltransferase/amino-acid acetyltransferase ArgJ [Rhodospirillaceae bacterium]
MAAPPRSPLAPASPPSLPAVAGVRVAGISAGLKKAGGRDLFVAELAEGTTVAGTLTRSRCPSAPVDWCRRQLPHGHARVFVVNSGNANAFTGNAGDKVVDETVAGAVATFGCQPQEVFLASTGVIGQPVPANKIAGALPAAQAALAGDGWSHAADAIRTTDTFAKLATATAEIAGVPVTINGIAKGSGMIAPDMATMLAFLFTDASVPAPLLDRLLRRAVDRSFNSTTVDGDTSTSDTVLLAATAQAATPEDLSGPADPRLAGFRAALDKVCVDLAQQIVRDGEGASKFVTIDVTGAVSARSARRIGLAIANSPLVKTAIAGQDANWGRIVMAVGKAGEPADRDRLSISMGGVQITRDGQIVPGYDETPVAAHMKGPEIDIAVDIGLGRGKATVWTCDLTDGYIRINADYRS